MNCEGCFKVFEHGMLRVLFAEDCFVGWDAPVDAEAFIGDGDAVVGFGMVELIAFVLEDSRFAQHSEAVGEAFRYEELAVIVLCEFDGDVLAVGRGAFTDVNGYVQDGAFDTANEFALGEWWALEMQTTHHAVA